jgi:hypothetical protein
MQPSTKTPRTQHIPSVAPTRMTRPDRPVVRVPHISCHDLSVNGLPPECCVVIKVSPCAMEEATHSQQPVSNICQPLTLIQSTMTLPGGTYFITSVKWGNYVTLNGPTSEPGVPITGANDELAEPAPQKVRFRSFQN